MDRKRVSVDSRVKQQEEAPAERGWFLVVLVDGAGLQRATISLVCLSLSASFSRTAQTPTPCLTRRGPRVSVGF